MQNPSDFSALVETRKPVWIALSELFLDVDPSLAYDYIARTLAASPYTLNELYAILCDEVAPLLKSNLSLSLKPESSTLKTSITDFTCLSLQQFS